MSQIKKEFMSENQSRKVFNKIFFKNGKYSDGFKKAICDGVKGMLLKDCIILHSSTKTVEELNQIILQQKTL